MSARIAFRYTLGRFRSATVFVAKRKCALNAAWTSEMEGYNILTNANRFDVEENH